uniref:Rho GTPase activating protein 33 n=1 Tax=Latimeria chalumnae TaxID=7897 RepID=H3ABC7_LATCH
LQARSTDNLDTSGELPHRCAGGNASVKGKNIKRLSVLKGHFPKLAECAHFHYENVDLGTIQLALAPEQNEVAQSSVGAGGQVFLVRVCCQGKTWFVRRSYEEFRTLDSHLHLCIYDRRFSCLTELPSLSELGDRVALLQPLLSDYLMRLSLIVDNKLNCGPVLTWMEIDNRGNRLLVNEEASINVPAIAAAHVTKRYTAQASDELSFEVGDIVSVIDMPPKEDTTWWRGKHGFQVGFFPRECVDLINEKLTHSVTAPSLKPGNTICSVMLCSDGLIKLSPAVSRKHGKLIGFLRNFMKSRPSKQKLKQRGILKERVFGCDLGEHLLNSGQDVPQVLKSCSGFIEKHGIVDGIYRLSGISSNIQKLRHEFDSEQIPELTRDVYLQDIHCVGSLCKLYFRELPNPLLTYQLYDKFAPSLSIEGERERVCLVRGVAKPLPPICCCPPSKMLTQITTVSCHAYKEEMASHTLGIFLVGEVGRVAEGLNLGVGGRFVFFSPILPCYLPRKMATPNPEFRVLTGSVFCFFFFLSAGRPSLTRPKSILLTSPSNRLLTLEEAQARTQAQILTMVLETAPQSRNSSTGLHRRKSGAKVRKLTGGSWKTFFAIGKTASAPRAVPIALVSATAWRIMVPSLSGTRAETTTLRSTKSEESLCSQTGTVGLPKLQRLRRPRSSSDALSVSMESELFSGPKHCKSYDSVQGEDQEGIYVMPDFSHVPSIWAAEDDLDLSPPSIGGIGLDFDPFSFQCSPPRWRMEDSETSGREKLSKSTSFTKRMTHATAAKGPKSPPMDISDPISSTVPAKVLEMISKTSGEPQGPGAQQGAGQPTSQASTQMISMLLKSCDAQLTDSCQREIRRKLSVAGSKAKGSSGGILSWKQPPAIPLIHRQVPPPPPPKNAARLMALALAESAHQALRQSSNPTGSQQRQEASRASQARLMRSLSVDCNQNPPVTTASPLYSTVRSLSVARSDSLPSAPTPPLPSE